MKDTRACGRPTRCATVARTMGVLAVCLLGAIEALAAESGDESEEGRTVTFGSYDAVTGKITTETAPASVLPKRVPGVPVPWRMERPGDLKCGVKALFVFLRMHDVPVALEDLEGELTVGEKGVDMLQLKEAARRHGVKAQVVKCSPSDLEDALPAIVHLTAGSQSDASHYHVVTGLSEKHVHYVEPTSCRFERRGREALSRHFSGHALVREPGGAWAPLVSFLLAVIACGQVAAIGVMWWHRSGR